jgi:hypothetical protein
MIDENLPKALKVLRLYADLETKSRTWAVTHAKLENAIAFRFDRGLVAWFDDNSTMIIPDDGHPTLGDPCTIEDCGILFDRSPLY